MDSNTPENQQQPAKKDKFDPKKPPDKSNPEEVYNYVAKRISGPTFRNPLKNFIDENCITFIDVDENTFEQGQLFKELNQLLENLLDDVLKDGQLTQEDFLKAAERGIEDKQYKKYFNQVINFGDYTFFKSIMTKRNYQIIKMAEQQMTNAKNMTEEKVISKIKDLKMQLEDLCCRCDLRYGSWSEEDIKEYDAIEAELKRLEYEYEIPIQDAVEIIYDAGGIPVIAHPHDLENIAENLIKDLMNYGLRGIEAYHRKHSPAMVEYFSSMAENLGLIVTGGSDFHAPNIMNGQVVLGKNFIPEWVYEKLKEEKKRIDIAASN